MEAEEELACAVWDVVGRRWMPQILRLLSDGGPHRFSELLVALDGISTTTLSARLEELKDAALVEKTFFAEIPPRVEYRITEKGEDLCSVICGLADFAVKWEMRVKIVRKRR